MQYLSLKELSERLGGRSRSSIYRDVADGRLPRPFKVGRLNYWSEAEVDAALASSRSDAIGAGKAGAK